MAFSFANVASSAAGIGAPSQGVHIQDGQELKEIQTGKLGFKTINGETKVKLFPSPWSLEDPPAPTSQLLGVASSQGIVAAAGPNELIIASTDAIRDTLSAKEGDNIRDLEPILATTHDRLTHVAFSSDESILVVSGPSTGGLIAYQVEKLKAGQANVALQIQSRTTLRALVPNPNPQQAYLFAAVDIDGKLLIADFSKGQFVGGSNDGALIEGVACVSWSNRGKQLVAGLASGTAVQLKPDGSVVTHIPKSTSIPDETYVAAVSWLEDDVFFFIYTPSSTSTENGIPPSEYYIIERSNKTDFTFHRLPEILPPFGAERLPTHHFVARLRKFDPHISDLLFLSATTATDVGIISKSTESLVTSDDPEEQVSNEFAFTAFEDDTRRAALPLSGADDTSPIGMVIDLSSKESVINPLPSDPEIEESIGPVPNLLVLNHEGLLCSWWVIYDDSIKQKTTFSGFDGLRRTEQVRSAVSPPAESEATPQPAPAVPFNQTSSTTASPFARPTAATAQSPFVAPAGQSAFGAATPQPSSQPVFGSGTSFGAASKIGENKPSWTSTGFSASTNTTGSGFGSGPAFGQSASGTSTISSINNTTPAFGSATPFGNKATPFGQVSSPAFGQTGFGTTKASPFANAGGSTTLSGFASFAHSGGFSSGSDKKDIETSNSSVKSSTTSGFASFASTGGFGAASNKTESTESPFAKPGAKSGFGGFGQTANFESPFSKPGVTNTFGAGQNFGGAEKASSDVSKGTFSSVNTFQVGSSFKGDGTAKDDLPAPSNGKGFGFGAGLEGLLEVNKKNISSTQNREAEMNDDEDSEDRDSASTPDNERPFAGFSPEQKPVPNRPSTQFTTPPSTITQTKTTPAPPVSTLFANQPQSTTPQSGPAGFAFGSTTPKETPAASRTMFGTKPIASTTPAAVQTSEPVRSFDAIDKVPKDSLPVKGENTTKIKTEPPSDDETVDIKSIPEAPLPPDPISKPGYTTGDTSASSANSKTSKEHDDAPLPPDFLPANKSASKDAEHAQLPEDEDEDEDDGGISSDFEDSGEDVTQEFSPAEEGEDDQDEDATTEHIQTSPESSFKGGDTTSPTGGLFTKVSAHDNKPARPLFGEVGRSAPIFPPPKPQQSPRSPSPVRPFLHNDTLRSDSRSVSAPLRPSSAIQQRKTDYMQSNIAAQAMKAREEEAHRERVRLEASKSAAEQAKAEELQTLEDDDDERIQKELASPAQPSENLDEFMTYQAGTHTVNNKTDIPTQIERLYQDINSMVCTTGINARSLTAFMMYQKEKEQIRNWPHVLQSESPFVALDEEWSLNDTRRLHEGMTALANTLEQNQIQEVAQKLESCQDLLTKDLFELRTKITTIRKSLHARANGANAVAPLSAEQASIQHDLRKASALVQTKLIQSEDILAVMRAKLAEVSSQTETNVGGSISSNYTQKKPTVEAVTNTIAKMTSMAEKKSADIDVLEAQLKKLDTTLADGARRPVEFRTPRQSRISHSGSTPNSTTSSVFYTPDSKAETSTKFTRSIGGNNFSMSMISGEDRDRWQVKARRKRGVANTLRAVLEDKQKRTMNPT